MKPAFNHKISLAGLVIAILLAPVTVETGSVQSREGGLEQLTGFVVVQQGAALVNGESAMFNVYLDQLNLVRRSYENRDQERTYTAMNRFMDMLETREGGIRVDADRCVGRGEGAKRGAEPARAYGVSERPVAG